MTKLEHIAVPKQQYEQLVQLVRAILAEAVNIRGAEIYANHMAVPASLIAMGGVVIRKIDEK